MDFMSCLQPLDLSYRHKKFDKRQRSSDSITDTDTDIERSVAKSYNYATHIISNTTANTAISTCSPGIYSPAAKRPFTPYTDSDSVHEYAHFKANFNARSTPRNVDPCLRRVDNDEDSGIALTPRKRPLQRDVLSVALKRRRLANISSAEASGIAPVTTTIPTPTPTATRQLPTSTAAVLRRISEDKLRSICTYHGNMVRKFPKKQRSAKDQERRDKNTVACRMSRRVKKLEHIAVEVQYKEYEQQHLAIVEETLRAAAYLQQLIKLTAAEDAKSADAVEREQEIDVVGDDAAQVEEQKRNGGFAHGKALVAAAAAMAGGTKKLPFSIDYLIA